MRNKRLTSRDASAMPRMVTCGLATDRRSGRSGCADPGARAVVRKRTEHSATTTGPGRGTMRMWQGACFAALLTAAAQTPALAQQKTVTWVTHPAILKATGDGELLRKFEQQTGIKVEVTTFPTDA